MLFYASFTTGLQIPVSRLAEAEGLRVVSLMDGALLYEAPEIRKLPCFVNLFAVLSWRAAKSGDALAPFMKTTAGRMEACLPKESTQPGTFRIIISVENKLVSADPAVKARLEREIAVRTGLKADRGGSGQEFWFLYRREGYVFFMRRLTTHTAYDKILRKGELHPELAYMLQVLSRPADNDMLLDPFCGYGAIPAARLRHFPCKAVYASDDDPEKVKATENTLRAMRPAGTQIECRTADINALPEDWRVNKIVTDPPWGLFDEGADIRALYVRMLKIFLRVTVDGGIIVVLTSRKELLRELLSCPENGGLVLRETYDILVSGKKAGVFVMERG